jgi:hypothetical protein
VRSRVGLGRLRGCDRGRVFCATRPEPDPFPSLFVGSLLLSLSLSLLRPLSCTLPPAWSISLFLGALSLPIGCALDVLARVKQTACRCQWYIMPPSSSSSHSVAASTKTLSMEETISASSTATLLSEGDIVEFRRSCISSGRVQEMQ